MVTVEKIQHAFKFLPRETDALKQINVPVTHILNDTTKDVSNYEPLTAPNTPDLQQSHKIFNFSMEEVFEIIEEQQNSKLLVPRTEIVLIIVYAILIASGVISNLLVSFVVIRQSTQKKGLSTGSTSRNLYIVNLTIADLALCCVCMPFTLVSLLQRRWTLGVLLCKLVPVVQGTNIMVSAGTITAIALDRYCTIVQSPRGQNSSSGKACSSVVFIIAAVWLSSLFVSSPLFFLTSVEPVMVGDIVLYDKCVEVWPSPELQTTYTVVLSLIQFLIPVLVLSVIHLKISAYLNLHLKPINKPKIKVQSPTEPKNELVTPQVNSDCLNTGIRKNSNCSQRSSESRKNSDSSSPRKRSEFLQSFRETSNFSGFSIMSNNSERKPKFSYKNHKRARRELRRNRRTMIMLSCIAIVYGVSWLPYTVFSLFCSISPGFIPNTHTFYTVFAVCHIIAMSTACTNPLLYGWLNTNFRCEFTKLFRSFSRCFSKVLGFKDFNKTKSDKDLMVDVNGKTYVARKQTTENNLALHCCV